MGRLDAVSVPTVGRSDVGIVVRAGLGHPAGVLTRDEEERSVGVARIERDHLELLDDVPVDRRIPDDTVVAAEREAGVVRHRPFGELVRGGFLRRRLGAEGDEGEERGEHTGEDEEETELAAEHGGNLQSGELGIRLPARRDDAAEYIKNKEK